MAFTTASATSGSQLGMWPHAFSWRAQVHVHDARAGVEGVARLGGHLRQRHRHRVLLGWSARR